MTIRPDEILGVAQLLASHGGEAEHRSAVSRAYYAAMHSAIAAIPIGYEPNVTTGSSHEEVVVSLKAFVRANLPGRYDAIMIADSLPKLKAARKRADYYLDMMVSQRDADVAIADARRILTHCDSMVHRLNAPKAVAEN